MCGHGAGWALECPHPHPYPFKFASNYPYPDPYLTMWVFTRVFFAGAHWAWVQLPSLLTKTQKSFKYIFRASSGDGERFLSLYRSCAAVHCHARTKTNLSSWCATHSLSLFYRTLIVFN